MSAAAAHRSASERPRLKPFVVCSTIGLETGSGAQDHIGHYGGDAKLLGESLEYIQRTAIQILNAVGADFHIPIMPFIRHWVSKP
jgi:hypothetical protein